MTRQEKKYKSLNEFARSQQDLAFKGKAKVNAPKGFEPVIRWDNKNTKGSITSRGLKKEDDPRWDDYMIQWGFDPKKFRVKQDTVQFRCWDANYGKDENGDPLIQTLYYYKCDLELKSPEYEDVDYKSLVDQIKKHKKRPKKQSTDPLAFLVCLADWQMGVRSSDKIVDRVLQGIEDVENRIKDLERIGVRPDQLVIGSLGDLIENCGNDWYPAQTAMLDIPSLRTQTMIARRLIMKCIQRWSKLFNDVIVFSVPANHGGNGRRGGKATTDPAQDNKDLELFDSIAEACALTEAYKDIKFVIPERSFTVTLDIKGVHLTACHGHNYPRAGQDSIAKQKKWAMQQSLGSTLSGSFDVLLNGHFHYTSYVEEYSKFFIQAPCLMEPDEQDWYSSKYGSVTKPGILTFVLGGEKKLQHFEVL